MASTAQDGARLRKSISSKTSQPEQEQDQYVDVMRAAPLPQPKMSDTQLDDSFPTSDSSSFQNKYHLAPNATLLKRARLSKDAFPWRSAGLAVFLFTVGIIFVVASFYKAKSAPWSDAMPLFILGCISSYAVFILIMAWMEFPGYAYHNLPSYD